MKTYTTTLQDGGKARVEIVFEAHHLAVHRGTNTRTRDKWVITDTTTDHTFATAHGVLLTFDVLEQAIAAVGVLMATWYGMDVASAIAAIKVQS